MTNTRACFLASVSAILVQAAVATPACAQVRQFDVTAQPAATGIPIFAHQAGIQILAPSGVVDGININRVQGAMTVAAALRQLLSGTDLVPVNTANAIVLKRRSATRIALASLNGSAVAHMPAGVPPVAVSETTSQDVVAPEPIVVTGIRASLQESIEAKRSAGNIVDVISAQDIGKLPDQNVAESLSRITGVQITRREGEGSNFTVRGISQNRLEINGRTYLGPTANGTPALETLSPEILSSIVVSKSPSADMAEGALGATVNLRTKRPLDLKELVVSGRVQGAYADQAEHVGVRASALISSTFAGNSFGVLASVAYSNMNTLGYQFDTGGWTRTDAIDGDGDGVDDPGLVRPNRMMARIYDRHEERLTANATLQWRPADNLEFIIDGTYSRLNRTRNDANYQVLYNNDDVDAQADANGTVVSGTFAGVTVRPLVYDEPTAFETGNIGASAEWKLDRLTVRADGSYSRGEGSDGGPGASFVYVVVPKDGNVANASYDFSNGNYLPDLAIDANFDLDDPGQYRLNSIYHADNQSENEGYDFRLDLQYDLGWDVLDSVEIGARYENIELFASYPINTPSASSLLAAADANGDGIIDIDELPGIVYENNFGPFYPGVGGAFPRDLLTGTVDQEAAAEGLGLPALDPFGPISVGLTSIANIKTSSWAEYAKINLAGYLGGIRYSGNAGIRLLQRQRTSAGYLGEGEPTSQNFKFNYALPSANLKFELTPDLSLRFAAAKVVSRPNINDLKVSFVPNTVNFTGSRGNPALRPFEATQFDASLEWYFGPSSALTAAVFRKNVDSFTINTITQEFIPGYSETYGLFNISQPANGERGSVQGIELSYQHLLTFLPGPLSNLGVQANYTYVDSSTPLTDPETGAALPLPGLSENNYNLIGFYEDDRFSIRFAYTYRDEYLAGIQGANSGGNIYQKARGQLDASAQFSITESVRLILEGVNLNRVIDEQYLQYPNRIYHNAREDRRIFFGAAVSF